MAAIWMAVAVFLVSGSDTLAASRQAAEHPPTATRPNIVVIFIDDLGYADIGPFGARGYQTPALDRMAREGRKFTDFVVSSAVCSASRAALMTGCYHERVGIRGALGPNSPHGIAASETTLGELCRDAGYATACFGKWHLGHHRQFLPLQNGFDEYYGLPYSNDMWPLHPDYVDLPPDAAKRKQGYPDLPMLDGNEICDSSVDGADQMQLTAAYTRRSIEFIERNRDRPFLLYLPHSMVHVPLFVSEKFRNSGPGGMFGDVMREVDWSVGSILDKLKELNIDDRTLVIFTSDNGPWLSYGDHAGSAFPLREGKGTMFEGGARVPTLMRWPGKIPAGTECSELASTIDVLPTVASLIGAKLPNLPIDGHDISPLLFGDDNAASPHASFYYYYGAGELQAVRDRQWKLVLPHKYRSLEGQPGGTGGRPAPYRMLTATAQLFDLKADPGELVDVSGQFPEQVKRLQGKAEQARDDLGDSLTERVGRGVRPCDRFEDESSPQPVR